MKKFDQYLNEANGYLQAPEHPDGKLKSINLVGEGTANLIEALKIMRQLDILEPKNQVLSKELSEIIRSLREFYKKLTGSK